MPLKTRPCPLVGRLMALAQSSRRQGCCCSSAWRAWLPPWPEEVGQTAHPGPHYVGLHVARPALDSGGRRWTSSPCTARAPFRALTPPFISTQAPGRSVQDKDHSHHFHPNHVLNPQSVILTFRINPLPTGPDQHYLYPSFFLACFHFIKHTRQTPPARAVIDDTPSYRTIREPSPPTRCC